MAVDLLSSLPDSLIHSLFADWLSSRSLGRLDSALCVKSSRPHLAAMFAPLDWTRAFSNTKSMNSATHYQSALKWLLARNLHASQVFILGDFCEECTDLIEQLLIQNSDHTRAAHVYLPNTSQDSIRLLSVHCTQLRRLTYIFTGEASPHLMLTLRRNESLEDIRLSSYGSNEMETILRSVHCPSVTKLELCHDMDVHAMECAVKAFPNASAITFESLECDALPVLARLPVKSLFLRELEDSDFQSVTLGGGHSFTHLEKLEIRSWSKNAALRAIFAKAPRLHTVKLDLPEVEGGENEMMRLGANILPMLSAHIGSRLQVLELGGLCGMPECDLQLLAKHCPNIRQLKISYCSNAFKDESTLLLLPRWPKLTHFLVHDLACSAALLGAIVMHCPLIQCVAFETYTFNVDLADWFLFIQQAKCLQSVVLCGEKYPLEAKAFTAKYRVQEQIYIEELSWE